MIGGSIGLALRTKGLAGRVVGIGRDRERLEAAREMDAIDEVATSLALGVREADVVVVCTPVTRIGRDVIEAAHEAPSDVLVTDAGSTKRLLVGEVEADIRARAVFVGAHPIAGSERKGALHGRADLFEGRVCALTITEHTPADRLERARRFWRGIGCRLVEMDPARHDEALATTSHLPHAVAAALAGTVPMDQLHLAAGAYRDGTRVAGSDGTLWAGIFLANRQAMLEALSAYEATLDALRLALEARDQAAIEAWWELARRRRLKYDESQGNSAARVDES